LLEEYQARIVDRSAEMNRKLLTAVALVAGPLMWGSAANATTILQQLPAYLVPAPEEYQAPRRLGVATHLQV
jgi:hypothetical protein